MSFFLIVASAACLAWLILVVLVPQLRRRLLDVPNARSSHCQPTPRGGGVVFVLVTAVACAIGLLVHDTFSGLGIGESNSAVFALPFLALPLAVVGFLDDLLNLPTGLRYGVQSVTVLFLTLLSPLPIYWYAVPFVLIAATAIINFTNFMDGLDGLVAGCMITAISVLSIEISAPWTLWALVGALIGFLPWNWNPAKVFMGDVGSTFLGAVFAGLVLQAHSWPEALGLLLVATPLLGDACLCVLRRLFSGQRVLQAHRLHLFQRLHQAGWSHARVSSFYIAATGVLSVTLLSGNLFLVILLAGAELLVGFWLDQHVAVPFKLASSYYHGLPPTSKQ